MGFVFLFLLWCSFFKECPHPDEKQRLEMSRRLSLETKQVKFWFQNRRTQMKVSVTLLLSFCSFSVCEIWSLIL